MTDDPRRWTRLASRPIVDRWWLRLREDRVRLPSGLVLEEFHVTDLPDWAAVLALTPDGRAVVVEQYRYGIDRVTLELPAGALDAGESPLAAARRELREETGFEADDWTRLAVLAPEPSRSSGMAHLFLARNARQVSEATPDDSESLTVRLAPVAGLLDEPAFEHAVHVAAVAIALARGQV